MTVGDALERSALVPIDAQVLLAHVLGVDRAWLVAHADEALSVQQSDRFAALAARRRAGEPVAYLTGVREFWGLPLRVDPRVLIPRPETETLVECALEALPAERTVRVLDVGTGSGAIALAIARERPEASIVGIDRSEGALAVAHANASGLKLANVTLLQSDWYDALPDEPRFDLIVGNPPYVPDADPHLTEGDVRFEPAWALRAGMQGLDALRIVVAGAPSHLVRNGVLAVEHGFDQGPAVRALLREAGFARVATRVDLAGLERVSTGRMP